MLLFRMSISGFEKIKKIKDMKKKHSMAIQLVDDLLQHGSETTNKRDKGYFLSFSLNYLNGLLFSLSFK